MKTLTVAALAIGLTLAPTSLLAADHAVTIKGFAFSPAELSIAAGDTVTFTNEDGAPHTATADDGSFDTGTLRNGESATITFDAAGSFAYFCQIHTSMTAAVTVQ